MSLKRGPENAYSVRESLARIEWILGRAGRNYFYKTNPIFRGNKPKVPKKRSQNEPNSKPIGGENAADFRLFDAISLMIAP
jgi:hypothetical protein